MLAKSSIHLLVSKVFFENKYSLKLFKSFSVFTFPLDDLPEKKIKNVKRNVE